MGAVPIPRIASIDYYGLHKVPENRVQRALGLKAGDAFPPSKGDIEERLEQLPGVVTARLEAVCCGSISATILRRAEQSLSMATFWLLTTIWREQCKPRRGAGARVRT